MIKKHKIKKNFIERLNEIQNVKALDVPKKVVLVNKQFHDDLVNWLTTKKTKSPKNLNTDFLVDGDKIKSNLKRGVDYEIIGGNLWGDITKKFGTAQKVEAILIRNPKSGEDTVLITNVNCIQFNIYLPKKIRSTNLYSISKMPIEYYSHSDWLLEDVKNKICELYDIDKSMFSFTKHKTSNLNDRIDEKSKMIQVLNIYKNELDLRRNKLGQMQEKTSKKNGKSSDATNLESMKMHKNPSALASDIFKERNIVLKSPENSPKNNNKKVAKQVGSNSKQKTEKRDVLSYLYASSSDPSTSSESLTAEINI